MNNLKKRMIALVDCDCFFVSCERLDNPALNGKPVCVTTGGGMKGVVVSRSREAKALGIKMGEPLFRLSSFGSDVYYLTARHERYRRISRCVMSVLRNFTPDVEEISIDEAYLDLTGMDQLTGLSYETLLQKIRDTVLKKTHIPVSIGLSTSKTLAKLASDKAKKNGGICIIYPNQIYDFLRYVRLKDVCGIGHNSEKVYRKKGIYDIESFLKKDPVWVRRALGINGERLRYELAGICVSPVCSAFKLPQSIQDTHALDIFTNKLSVLQKELNDHIHRASRRLRQYDGYCGVLGVMVRTKTFQVFQADMKLIVPTNSEFTLLKKAHCLMEKLYCPGIMYRATGVMLQNLVFGQAVQPSLFDVRNREDDRLSRLIDVLEDKFGERVVHLGL